MSETPLDPADNRTREISTTHLPLSRGSHDAPVIEAEVVRAPEVPISEGMRRALLPGEFPVYIGHVHPIALLRPTIGVIVLCYVLARFWITQAHLTGSIHHIDLRWVLSSRQAVLDLATLILGVPTIRWWLRTLIRVLGLTAIVTNRRVFIQRITFGLSREVLPNGGLTMVRVRKSPLGSIFHFGSLFLPATANSAARELRDMRDPEDLERVMQMVGNGVVNGTWPMARRQTIIP